MVDDSRGLSVGVGDPCGVIGDQRRTQGSVSTRGTGAAGGVLVVGPYLTRQAGHVAWDCAARRISSLLPSVRTGLWLSTARELLIACHAGVVGHDTAKEDVARAPCVP
ncbi:hypothetical protein SSP24_63760 [Streptomyces spinoverrucosus]|uniref:Uncharacterized protein n=1 Tax=Streptomyces spinoverrucosus TaxID=284043 RepID=A0A4Y3VSF2_9ACTN|nr:hypothetical protein SSP24_63760 [Streptomyces spinoverrucosus]GHB64327.1 hypothetical protein GCM10010397_38050 [Streptomyces spinoverrucosus]